MKSLCLPLFFVCLLGCQSKPSDLAPETAGPPPALIDYKAISGSIGKRVTLRAWVVAEGKSFKAVRDTDEYYFLLLGEAKLDWGDLARQVGAIEELLKKVRESDEPKARAGLVQEYTQLESKVTEWSESLKLAESSSTSWGRFRRDVIGSEYGTLDGPVVLVSPTRQELEDAVKAILNRVRRMQASCEVEITGTVFATSEWPKSGQQLDPLTMGSIRKVPSIIEVDSIKVLKQAKDQAPQGGPVGTPGGGGPLKDPGEAP